MPTVVVGKDAHTSIRDKLFSLSLSTLLLAGGVVWIIFLLIFALLFYACGKDCFESDIYEETDFSFVDCLWLSTHTWSSVGYGSIAPRCVAAEIIVVLETYCALVYTAVVAGRIFFEVRRPKKNVIFSRNLLFKKTKEGHEIMCFRFVRISAYCLRDAQLLVQACFIAQKPDGTEAEMTMELQSDNARKSEFNFWEFEHHMNTDDSPLWNIDKSRLRQIIVSFRVYDPVVAQEVRYYQTYLPPQFVNGEFVNMVTQEERPGGHNVLMIEYRLLDEYRADASTTSYRRSVLFRKVTSAAPVFRQARTLRSSWVHPHVKEKISAVNALGGESSDAQSFNPDHDNAEMTEKEKNNQGPETDTEVKSISGNQGPGTDSEAKSS